MVLDITVYAGFQVEPSYRVSSGGTQKGQAEEQCMVLVSTFISESAEGRWQFGELPGRNQSSSSRVRDENM